MRALEKSLMLHSEKLSKSRALSSLQAMKALRDADSPFSRSFLVLCDIAR